MGDVATQTTATWPVIVESEDGDEFFVMVDRWLASTAEAAVTAVQMLQPYTCDRRYPDGTLEFASRRSWKDVNGDLYVCDDSDPEKAGECWIVTVIDPDRVVDIGAGDGEDR